MYSTFFLEVVSLIILLALAFCVTSAAFKRQVRQTKIDAALSSLIEELDGTPGVNEELNEVKELCKYSVF